MIKRLLIVLCVFSALRTNVRADEGMWLVSMISEYGQKNLSELGAEITPEEIYSINSSSLKDAIVIFGRGCTGELISNEGLILTNHHCGYASIQQHSTVDHDYLKEGFWAKEKAAEIPTTGLTVSFLKEIVDVTQEFQDAIKTGVSEPKRRSVIDSITSVVKKLYSDSVSGYDISIRAFYSGNKYYLFKYQVFNDVRFVGAPPSSIGNFGDETDNWMWPRHVGDFSLFRVYCAPDGKPAKYSAKNVPYKSKSFLPVSLKGYEAGDFSMTMGYPGSTDRYLTSWGIEERMNLVNQSRIKIRKVKQDAWMTDMMASQAVNIKYASKFARSANYYKNSIGMNLGLKKLDVLNSKRKLEKDFADWIVTTGSQDKYGETLNKLAQGYEGRAKFYKPDLYLNEALVNGAEIFSFAGKIGLWASGRKHMKVNPGSAEIIETIRDFYKDYDVSTDKKALVAILPVFFGEIGPEFIPASMQKVKSGKMSVEEYVDKLFKNSVFADSTRLISLIRKGKFGKLVLDDAYVCYNEIRNLRNNLESELASYADLVSAGRREFEAGLKEMYGSSKVLSPDANFTMRASFGHVGGYSPKDGVKYLYYTSYSGILEKEIPGDREFSVDPRLKLLFLSKDFGPYADKDGVLRINFLTNNDITGGNSGSPVINKRGELFGLAFDGNWEAMSGDIAFEPKLQKTICVDIRYVLFVIDKFAGATNLIEELKIVD